MDIEKQIKILLLEEKLTLTTLTKRISEMFGRKETVQNLSNKFKRGSVRYSEALEMAAALGYSIEWVKQQPSA